MIYEQINSLFKQRYNQSNWKQFLGEAFVNSRLLVTPEILTGIDSDVASQVQKLGHITLNENGKGDWAAIQSAAKKIAGISGADEALANNDSFNAKDLTKKLASAKIMEGRLDSPAYAALALKSLGITDEESKWYTYKDGKNVLSGGGIDSDRLKSDSKWIRESIAGMGGKEEDNLIYKYGNEVGGAYEKELKLAGLALGKDDSNEKKDPIKELIDVLKNIFGENASQTKPERDLILLSVEQLYSEKIRPADTFDRAQRAIAEICK